MAMLNFRHLNIVIVVMKRRNVQFFSHLCLGRMPIMMEEFFDITLLVLSVELRISLSNFAFVYN